MRIEVEAEHGCDTQIWEFTVIGDLGGRFTVKLNRYMNGVRKSRRHKWDYPVVYDRLDSRNNRRLDGPPEVPAVVATQIPLKLLEAVEYDFA